MIKIEMLKCVIECVDWDEKEKKRRRIRNGYTLKCGKSGKKQGKHTSGKKRKRKERVMRKSVGIVCDVL